MFRSIKRNHQTIEAICAAIAILIGIAGIMLPRGTVQEHRQAEVVSPIGKKAAVILKYGNLEICTDSQGWFTIPTGLPVEAVIDVLALDRSTLGTLRLPSASNSDTTIRYVPVAPVDAHLGE